jgi:hypothetical protein
LSADVDGDSPGALQTENRGSLQINGKTGRAQGALIHALNGSNAYRPPREYYHYRVRQKEIRAERRPVSQRTSAARSREVWMLTSLEIGGSLAIGVIRQHSPFLNQRTALQHRQGSLVSVHPEVGCLADESLG